MEFVWMKKYNQLTDLVDSIVSFQVEKRKKSRGFKLRESIREVVKNVKNIQEEVANYLDSSRQSTIIIDEVVKDVKFTYSVNSQA